MLKNAMKGTQLAAAVVSLVAAAGALCGHPAQTSEKTQLADHSCSGKNGCHSKDPNQKTPKSFTSVA